MVWLKQICCLKDNEYPLLRFWKEAQKISLFFWFLSFSLCFCNLSPPCFFVLLPCSPILSPVLCVFLLLPRSWPFSGFYKARECHVVVTTGLVTTCIMGARDRSHKTCSMIETVLVPLLLKRLQHFFTAETAFGAGEREIDGDKRFFFFKRLYFLNSNGYLCFGP